MTGAAISNNAAALYRKGPLRHVSSRRDKRGMTSSSELELERSRAPAGTLENCVISYKMTVKSDLSINDDGRAGGNFTCSPPSAFTTTFPSPASAMTMMNRIAIVAAVPATLPTSLNAICASELPPRRMLADQHEEILHRAGEAHADHDPEQSRQISELRRQHRPDQRPRAADGGEVMAEQHPLVGRMKILPVVVRFGRRRSRVIQRRNLAPRERPSNTDTRSPAHTEPRSSPASRAWSDSNRRRN